MSSSWIVTAATLFRLIAVAAPMKSRILITRNLAYLTLTVIFGFSLVSIIPIYANMNRHSSDVFLLALDNSSCFVAIASALIEKARKAFSNRNFGCQF